MILSAILIALSLVVAVFAAFVAASFNGLSVVALILFACAVAAWARSGRKGNPHA